MLNTLERMEMPAAALFGDQFTPPQDVSARPLRILLAEDNGSDVLLMRTTLDATKIPYSLRVVRKGDQVLPSLRREMQAGGEGLPDLLVLDLGLPCADGFEVLGELSSAPPALRSIPVVILTGYQDFAYHCKDYRLWIPAYLNKPCDLLKLRNTLLHVRKPDRVWE